MAAAAVDESAASWLAAHVSSADAQLVAPVFAAQDIVTTADVLRLSEADVKELELDGAVRMRLQQHLNTSKNEADAGAGAGGAVAPPGGPKDGAPAAPAALPATAGTKPPKWKCLACAEPNPHGTKRCYACGATPDGAGGAVAAPAGPPTASAAGGGGGGGGGLWGWLTGKKAAAPAAPPPPAAVPVTMRMLNANGAAGGGGGTTTVSTSIDATHAPDTVAQASPDALAALETRVQQLTQLAVALKSTASRNDRVLLQAEPEVLMK